MALQVASELRQALILYSKLQPKRVLEIGVWLGGTLREWLRYAAPDAEVFAVDLHHPNERHYGSWRKEDTTLTLITGNSQSLEVMSQIQDAGPFDWVFIDGDHGLEAVFSDVNLGLLALAEDGMLLMHDIVPPDGEISYPPGIVLGWVEQSHRVERIVSDLPSNVSHGIGVVYA